MEVVAKGRFIRMSSSKARDMARAIQGKTVADALKVTTFSERKAAFYLGKTLKSAIANAENNHELSADNLVVKCAIVEEGPTMKRFMPRARGSASPIRKRTSHIRIVLTDSTKRSK